MNGPYAKIELATLMPGSLDSTVFAAAHHPFALAAWPVIWITGFQKVPGYDW